MPTDAGKPRQKRETGAAILAAIVLLIAVGGAGLYLLGRPLPQKAGSPPLAWGDRVERRMDAFIDGRRPAWTDRVEARLKKFANRVGWN